MISDEELYQLIKKAVRAKKTVPHYQTDNFAQNYCSQQLAKKRLKNHVKMEHIMKNFTKLDTYFDLPQLINSINQIKLKDQKAKMVATSKQQQKKTVQKAKFKINKHFSDYKNLRYVMENESIQGMLTEIETDNQWKSQHVKNNSGYNLGNLFERLSQERQNDTAKNENMKIFQLLQKYMDNENEFIHQQKEEDIKATQLNSEKKKQYTNFLHKVSSYLQIILESQHKNKWNKHRSSFVRKNLHTFANIYEQKVKPKYKTPKKPIISPLLSNTRYIQVLRQETRKIRQSSYDSKDETQLSGVKHKLKYVQSKMCTEQINDSKAKSQEHHLSSFYVAKHENEPAKIKNNFTFKRRIVKQKIINKLDKFIGEIDDETLCSRKQNSYYNKEINKLQVQMNHLYGRYKRQTLAGEKDIDNLKQFASRFQITSKAHIDDNSDRVAESQTQVITFSS